MAIIYINIINYGDRMWTKDEENFLIENWNKIIKEKICGAVRKNRNDIYIKAKELGIKINELLSNNSKTKRWSQEEIDILKNNYLICDIKQLEKLLNRGGCAIIQKADQLGFKKEFKWTDEEINILIKKFPTCVEKEFKSILPNRTYSSIKSKAKLLKIGKKEKVNKEFVWTEEQIELLKKLSKEKVGLAKICKILKKQRYAVKRKKKELDIQRKEHIWTEEELEILKKYYSNTHYSVLLSLLPNKNYRIISEKARNLGIFKNDSLLWTNEEIDILKKNYPYKDYDELEKLLNDKTKTQIRDKAKCLKLKKIPIWPDKETEILIKNYSNRVIDELLNLLPNKNKRQISSMAKRLGLKKSNEFILNHLPKGFKFPGKKVKWRLAILKRDNYICQECGLKDESGVFLQAHHIIPQRDESCNKYDINNGICLCNSCHLITRNKEYEYIEKYAKIVENKI